MEEKKKDIKDMTPDEYQEYIRQHIEDAEKARANRISSCETCNGTGYLQFNVHCPHCNPLFPEKTQ